MWSRVRFAMLSIAVLLALLPAGTAKAQSPSITIQHATYTYYSSWLSSAPGDMAAYGIFYVPAGSRLGCDFYFEAHVKPGVGTPDADGWSPLTSTQWTCQFYWQVGNQDLWYFTIYAPGSIVADNGPGWIAGVRARLYNYYSGTKVILASNEKWVVGRNGW